MGSIRLLSALSAVLLAAAASAAPAMAGGTLTRSIDADPARLDPQLTSTFAERDILTDLYEGLVVHDATAGIVPGVAESWEVSATGLTWTFHLRPSRWSNGDPVTAEDFVLSLRRLADPSTGAPSARLYSDIKNFARIAARKARPDTLGVEAVDPATLAITLERPVPELLELLAAPAAMPVHGGVPGDPAAPGAMVVNGPYKVAAFVPGAGVTLIRNWTFRDQAEVALDKVVYETVGDAEAGAAAFSAGLLDVFDGAPVYRLAEIRAEFGARFHEVPFLGTIFLSFDTSKPPFDEADIRRALAMTVDREAIAATVFGTTGVAAASLVPPGVPGYGEPATLPFAGQSADARRIEALRLLGEAGASPEAPVTFELHVPEGDIPRRQADALLAGWEGLPVAATILQASEGDHYALLGGDKPYGAGTAAWVGDYADAANFLDLFRSDNKDLNFPRYDNEEYDGLIAEARATMDPEVRPALLFRAETLLMRDVPILPLFHYASMTLVAERVAGWEDNVLNIHPSRHLSVAEPAAEGEAAPVVVQ